LKSLGALYAWVARRFLIISRSIGSGTVSR
jgi:hypothetical protein